MRSLVLPLLEREFNPAVVDAFSELAEVAPGNLSGALFDLGVSSPQIDQADRGFSYRHDAALDMRMDQSIGGTAAQMVNELPEGALAALFRQNGEGRLAGQWWGKGNWVVGGNYQYDNTGATSVASVENSIAIPALPHVSSVIFRPRNPRSLSSAVFST